MSVFNVMCYSREWSRPMYLVLCGIYLGYCLSFPTVSSFCSVHNSSDPIKLSQWSGTIESPGLAKGRYPNREDCQWSIEVSKGSKVTLTFDILNIEEGFYRDGSPVKQKNCFDFVKIKDYEDQEQTLCGEPNAPIAVTSRGNTMVLYFHSDEAVEGIGFRAHFTGVCEGEITEETVIASPDFPRPPPEGVTCSWSIKRAGRLASIIRALDVRNRVQSPQDFDKLLPRCGLSPFKIMAEGDGHTKGRELCLLDAVDGSVGEMTLTYSVSNGVQPWTGQLEAIFKDEISCHSLCINYASCTDSPQQPASGQLDYRCVCVDGYTGQNCEVELALADPCSVQSCEQGICENLPELGHRKCHCFDGYTGDSCEKIVVTAAPDPCVDVDCENGGVCIPLGTFGFLCDCPLGSGYIGKLCNIPVGSGYCQQEVDSFPGSGILWLDTPVGQSSFQPCPGNTRGNASRYCLEDRYSLTGGMMARPDLSQCVSPEVFQLSLDARQLLDTSMTSQTPASILNITSRLASITYSGLMTKDTRHHGLYPGDLLLSADVIKTISVATRRAKFVQTQEAMDLTQQYTHAVDNIVDPITENTWKNARSDLVRIQVTSLVKSTQDFLGSLFLQRPAFLTRMVSLRRNGAGVSDSRERMEGGVYRLTSRNIDIYISRYDQHTDFPSIQLGGNSSSVGFSTEVLDSWTRRIRSPSTIYVARFQSIATLLSFTDDRLYSSPRMNISIVNSDVVSAAVLNVPEQFYHRIKRPIILTFTLQNPALSQNLTKKCVFMNMTAASYEDTWSSDGCVVGLSNDTHVVCYCYHLTNFAVLMDVYETQAAVSAGRRRNSCLWKKHESLDKGQDIALTYISYIGGILSILGCLVTIITFQYLGLRNDRVRIHQQLGMSIILVQVLFMCVSITGEEHNTPLWGCRTLSILLHYSLTAMFSWMLVEGIHLYVVLVQIFDLGSHLKKYVAIGWGTPLVVVGISVGVFYDRYGTSKLCWLDHEILLVCFVPAVGLVILINTVILAVVIRIMIGSSQLTNKINQQERNNMKASLKATGVLLPLLGLTWVLGFLAVDTGGQHVMTYVFTYLFTLTNSFQGVLFFTFHCLLNVDVHLAYERRFKLKKRLSYAETTSTRARKLSEPDFFSPHRLLNNSKSTNTTRSTLTNLSLGDTRSSGRDRDPIIVDEVDKLPRLSMPWTNFNPAIIPEPDYHHHNQFSSDDLDDNIFQGSKTPSTTSSRRRHNTDSELGSDFMQIPRPQRNSVRFT